MEEQERLAREEQERLKREEQERLAREEQERLAREEQERQERAAREEHERLIREEQERLVREEQERVTREEQERLVENLAKQWKDRPKQKKPGKDQLEQEGSKTPRSQGGVRRGLGAKRRERPITQFALETLRDAEPQELTQEGPSPQPMAENER